MKARTHQLADERVAFAFDGQLGDAALQVLGFILGGLAVLGGRCGQLGNIVEDALKFVPDSTELSRTRSNSLD
jgi:hypothetical protein